MNKKNITFLVLLLGFIAFIAAVIAKRDDVEEFVKDHK